MNIPELQKQIHALARQKGWWSDTPTPTEIASKIALIHSELSEALEFVRDGGPYEATLVDGKPEGFVVEMADVVIRTLDLCGALGLNMSEAWVLRGTPLVNNSPEEIGKRIAFLHNDLSKAVEALVVDWYSESGLSCRQERHLQSALENVIEFSIDLCGSLGLDLEAAVLQKFEYNKTRTHRHGGRLL